MSTATRIAIILLAALLARVALLGNPLLYSDEQFYLVAGARMLEGAIPYVDIFDRKPPGLFLIYAVAAALGGGSGWSAVWAYQLLAALSVAATGFVLTTTARRLGAGERAALAGGISYALLSVVFEGGGGQSPVFFNLPMALAAMLVLTGRPSLSRGAAAMLLVGVAAQIKYTVLAEGVFFAAVMLWPIRRDLKSLALAMPLWAGMAALPSVLAMGFYAWIGAFDAFWFANVTSIGLREGGSTAGALAQEIALFLLTISPLTLLAILAAPRWRLVAAWFAVALAAVLAMRSFSLHYALPLLPPACVALAALWDRGGVRRGVAAGVLVLAALGCVATGVIHWRNGGRGAAAELAQAMRGSPNCPFVFDGPVMGYVLAPACTSSRYVFPTHLGWSLERRAIGIDPVSELTRIMDRRPALVLMGEGNRAVQNPAALALIEARLRRDYVAGTPIRFGGGDIVPWRLRQGLEPLPNRWPDRSSLKAQR